MAQDVSATETVEQLALLNFAGRLIMSHLDRDVIVDRAVDALLDFGRTDRLGLYLLTPDGRSLALAAGASPDGVRTGLTVDREDSPLGRIVSTKKHGCFPLAELGGAPYPAASPSGPPVGRRCYCAPLIESGNHVIGVAAFDHPGADHLDAQSVQALIMLLSLTAVSLVNARSFEELKRAHDELDGLNRAKTKMIEHLSHELKTPLAVIGASAALLKKDRVQSDPRRRNAALDRIQRGLDRLADMEAQTADIASGRAVQAPDRDRGRLERDLVLALLRQDPELQQAADRVEQRLEDLFDPPDQRPETIELAPFVSDLVDRLRPRFTHRRLTVTTDARADGRVFMPRHVLTKSVTGLIKNAVEATPDGGRVTVTVDRDQNAPRIEVTDTGVGLDPELRRHLFFGFVHSGSTADYSSKRPWDFGAGGQGLDLLRIKLFGRRWGFEIEYDSRSPRDPTGRSGARFALIFEPSPPARETT